MLIARPVSVPLPLPEPKLRLLRRAPAAVSSVVSVTAVPLALKISRKEWRGVAWCVSRCVRRRSSKVAFARVTDATAAEACSALATTSTAAASSAKCDGARGTLKASKKGVSAVSTPSVSQLKPYMRRRYRATAAKRTKMSATGPSGSSYPVGSLRLIFLSRCRKETRPYSIITSEQPMMVMPPSWSVSNESSSLVTAMPTVRRSMPAACHCAKVRSFAKNVLGSIRSAVRRLPAFGGSKPSPSKNDEKLRERPAMLSPRGNIPRCLLKAV
mmetsp:Transcript_15092/g.43283  ORF Transcript_15092/g.43283 Transcript_15092/m.43283 type:complete len:271 (+) Transcript_15092:1001-1813(+)